MDDVKPETPQSKSRPVKSPFPTRDILDLLFLPFLIIWFILVAWLAMNVPLDFLDGIGIGSATGIMLKCLSDMWQFYHRKAGPGGDGK